MQRTIRTTCRYRLDPTAEQEVQLRRFAGARRFIWNWALNRKREHYRETGKTLSYNDLAAELTRLKQLPATTWLREMDSQLLQQTLYVNRAKCTIS
jgi:putative transposase